MTLPAYINGFGGSVIFSAVTFPISTWTLNINAEALDTTNTGDSGWESNITGAKSWDGTFDMYFDSSAVPTDTLTIGTAATISLTIGSTGKVYTGSARLTQTPVENPVKGVVSLKCSFKGNGSLTYPT